MMTRQTYAFCLHCVEGDAGICLNAAKASMSQGAGNEDDSEAGSVSVGRIRSGRIRRQCP
jgi:hypothetical protein